MGTVTPKEFSLYSRTSIWIVAELWAFLLSVTLERTWLWQILNFLLPTVGQWSCPTPWVNVGAQSACVGVALTACTLHATCHLRASTLHPTPFSACFSWGSQRTAYLESVATLGDHPHLSSPLLSRRAPLLAFQGSPQPCSMFQTHLLVPSPSPPFTLAFPQCCPWPFIFLFSLSHTLQNVVFADFPGTQASTLCSGWWVSHDCLKRIGIPPMMSIVLRKCQLKEDVC